MQHDLHATLLKKYDVPVPRYTSYPTVPHWNTETFSPDKWQRSVKQIFDETNADRGISLYIHLPFCESLCTYCACNTRITKNHAVELRYSQALLKEWQLYLDLFETRPVIRELHLGGGTPTFFAPENLKSLLTALLAKATCHPEMEFSFEGHPNNTSEEHLQTLYDLGFRRVSFGVQDLDPKVQRTINRVQPFENVQRVVDQSRAIGYQSVSFDLVYGLPYQTKQSVEDTVGQIIGLKPDRIAFYSYAHVPWMRPGQRGYEDSDLPTDAVKRNLYEAGRALFLQAGYVDIGMDHFSLPHDALAAAHRNGTLHRNFMGYTTTSTRLLVGLGASSISDAHYAYAQNEKNVEAYEAQINAGKWSLLKGHLQTEDDQRIKRCILAIACTGHLSAGLLQTVITSAIRDELKSMADEGIVAWLPSGALQVTDLGRAFIRNICAVFDPHLRVPSEAKTFSRAI